MKRILIVAPVGSSMHLPVEQEVARGAVSADTQVVLRHLQGVPESIYVSSEEVFLPRLVEAVTAGEQDGFDAVGISCCSDPGLEQCRAAVDVPVSAPFEAVSKLLPAIGKISILYSSVPPNEGEAELAGEDWIPPLIGRYGCGGGFGPSFAVPVRRPVHDFRTVGATAEGRALIAAMSEAMDGVGAELAGAAVRQGATAVFPCSTYWSGMLGELRDRLPIAVLDPLEELARYLELLADARRSVGRSRLMFAHPVAQVPVLDGTATRFVNFDYAASAPPLASVDRAVSAAMATYASIHRGPSHLSRVSTAAYERARETVALSTGAREDDVVVFTRNTTDALTLLATCVPGRVVHLDVEHHANLLPWRRGEFTVVPARETLAQSLSSLARELERAPAALLSVAGASNVTGECPPLDALVELAHGYGARLAVDAAQLAPHRAIEISATGVDYLACSGHKLYAPYGTGVLIGRPDWLDAADPHQPGGGAVLSVSADGVEWKASPDRHEGGTPNLAGAVAIAAAFETLHSIGFDAIVAHELELYGRLLDGLAELGVETLRIWPEQDSLVGVASFNVPGYRAHVVAAYLSAEHGIGVRSGRFCAHPLLSRFGLGDAGAVRASIGLGTNAGDVELLLSALQRLIEQGPRRDYALSA
jgi:selenocysteine lyase/cysteine desulfurase